MGLCGESSKYDLGKNLYLWRAVPLDTCLQETSWFRKFFIKSSSNSFCWSSTNWHTVGRYCLLWCGVFWSFLFRFEWQLVLRQRRQPLRQWCPSLMTSSSSPWMLTVFEKHACREPIQQLSCVFGILSVCPPHRELSSGPRLLACFRFCTLMMFFCTRINSWW